MLLGSEMDRTEKPQMVPCRQSEEGEFSRRYEIVLRDGILDCAHPPRQVFALTALSMASALAEGGTQELYVGKRTYSSSGVKMHTFSTAECD